MTDTPGTLPKSFDEYLLSTLAHLRKWCQDRHHLPLSVITSKVDEGSDGLTITAFPPIVCLCGSTRFGEAFQQARLSKTLDGEIVLTVGCNMKSDAELFSKYSASKLKHIKAGLDELHKRKIDLCDYVLVLNVDGYIGESTRSEIDYALAHGKPVEYLE